MGLLDDAIREHLDLKRRRGADPSELARQEREALGPARAVDDGSAAAAGGPADAVATVDPPADEDVTTAGGAVSLSQHPVDDRIDDDVEWDDAPRLVRDPEPAPEAVAEGPPKEDVLEETPEFLSDTPEHDRLWFEQRPPRDFDFDD